ncbi:MAG TPA: HEAT repeat domain-containing protein [Bryobacteraceae bacterium]|nr:HEAT repeat domain-containing protein [Bryobacteraceae bacterium]
MKFYPQAVLTAALAVPAFCQAPPPPAAPLAPAPAADVLPTDPADQAAAIADAKAKAMADQQIFSDVQMEKFAAQAQAAADRIQSVDTDDIQMKIDAAAAKMQSIDMADMQAKVDAAADKMRDMQLNFNIDSDLDLKLNDLNVKLGDLAFLQGPKPAPAPPEPPAPMSPKMGRIFSSGRADAEYDAGTRSLDQDHYDEAVIHFDQVINSKSTRADGALYWKAYALNRAGKKDDALAALAQLRHDFPQSAWLNDAQALETEVKQSTGQPISPAQESNDDLKLLAINSLMNADPERAVPLIEGILKGNSPPKVKRNALFVLTQSRSPRAQQLLSDYAKGGGNPDLQLQAIRYLGQTGSRDAQQQLGAIYGTSSDTRVKQVIIDSLSGTRSWDALLNIAKTEKDTNLRNQAIRTLASNRGAPIDGLIEMYPNVDMSAKVAIIDGLQGRRDAKTMVDLARKETDPQMQRKIVERLGDMARDHNKDAMDYMMEILKQ